MSAPENTVYADGGAPVTGDGLNTFVQTVFTVSDLRAFVGVPGMQVIIQGTTAAGDGGQGVFWWNATGTAPDDNGATTVVPSGAGEGIWSRLATFYTPPAPMVSAIFSRTGAQAIPSGAYTQILWDTVILDPLGFYQAGSLVIPAGATRRLRIAANVGFIGSTTPGARGAAVVRNGFNEVGLPNAIVPATGTLGLDGFFFPLGYSAGHNFLPGDVVGVMALQDTGSDLNLAVPNYNWIQLDVIG